MNLSLWDSSVPFLIKGNKMAMTYEELVNYINSEKKHSGIASEYLNIISNKTGLKFDIYSNSWSKVIEKIKNKELDILACDGKTPEREAFLDFTTPYLSLDIVAVARKDLKLKSLEEIKNYKIAVQNGDYMYATIKKDFQMPNIFLLNQIAKH